MDRYEGSVQRALEGFPATMTEEAFLSAYRNESLRHAVVDIFGGEALKEPTGESEPEEEVEEDLRAIFRMLADRKTGELRKGELYCALIGSTTGRRTRWTPLEQQR